MLKPLVTSCNTTGETPTIIMRSTPKPAVPDFIDLKTDLNAPSPKTSVSYRSWFCPRPPINTSLAKLSYSSINR